jgi:hypothetical protein
LIIFEKFVFQTEPVNINEDSEGIDQSTQIRNQGIIALSYRDWEVSAACFLCGSDADFLDCRPLPKYSLLPPRRL